MTKRWSEESKANFQVVNGKAEWCHGLGKQVSHSLRSWTQNDYISAIPLSGLYPREVKRNAHIKYYT